MSTSTVAKAVLNNYRIVPVHGGGIAVLHGNGGQTTGIVAGLVENGRRLVRTLSGSIYELGAQHVSIWEIQLQLHRPEKYANLKKVGIL